MLLYGLLFFGFVFWLVERNVVFLFRGGLGHLGFLDDFFLHGLGLFNRLGFFNRCFLNGSRLFNRLRLSDRLRFHNGLRLSDGFRLFCSNRFLNGFRFGLRFGLGDCCDELRNGGDHAVEAVAGDEAVVASAVSDERCV